MSQIQGALNRLQFPCGAITGGNQFRAFGIGSKMFKPRQGVDYQVDRPFKTDGASRQSRYENNVRHGSFLCREESKKLEKSDKKAEILSEMQAHLEAAAGPYQPFDTRDGRLNRAARFLGMTYRRAKSIRYGEAKTIKAEELEAARERVAGLVSRNLSLAEQYVQFLRKQKIELETRYAKGDRSADLDRDVDSVGTRQPPRLYRNPFHLFGRDAD